MCCIPCGANRYQTSFGRTPCGATCYEVEMAPQIHRPMCASKMNVCDLSGTIIKFGLLCACVLEPPLRVTSAIAGERSYDVRFH